MRTEVHPIDGLTPTRLRSRLENSLTLAIAFGLAGTFETLKLLPAVGKHVDESVSGDEERSSDQASEEG